MSEISEHEQISVSIPIIHSEELNRRLEDKEFSDRIAAVTTTSMDAARRLLVDPTSNFTAYDFGYINLDLVDDVYDELTGRNRPDKISPAETITDNAEAYGQWQAAIGLLHERGVPSEKIRNLLEREEFSWFIERTLKDFSDAGLEERFSSYGEISSSLYKIWDKITPSGFDYRRECETALKDIFPKAKDVTGYLKDLRGREGVQVLLGDRGAFVDFVGKNKSEQIDTSGIRLHADIPRGLILGIVPRGEFEQEELLAA
jgi:hypothetical protein